MEQVVKIFLHPAGLQRVLIVKRSSGHYGYELEEFTHVYVDPGLRRLYPDEMFWNRPGQYPLSLCDTPETAEREARGHVSWLNSDVKESDRAHET